MKLHHLALAVAAMLAVITPASAQNAVQLPSFGFTTVNTTVSVPDGGSALMGGISRSSEGRVSRGMPGFGKVPFLNRGFRNQAIGSSKSAHSLRATATIINLDELDEAVLGEAAARRAARGEALGGERFVGGGGLGAAGFSGRGSDPDVDRKASYLSQNVGRGVAASAPVTAAAKMPSAEEIRRRNAAAKETRDSEAVAYFEKAEAALAEGKPGVAKIYYGMASKRATGEFKSQVVARLDALGASTLSP